MFLENGFLGNKKYIKERKKKLLCWCTFHLQSLNWLRLFNFLAELLSFIEKYLGKQIFKSHIHRQRSISSNSFQKLIKFLYPPQLCAITRFSPKFGNTCHSFLMAVFHSARKRHVRELLLSSQMVITFVLYSYTLLFTICIFRKTLFPQIILLQNMKSLWNKPELFTIITAIFFTLKRYKAQPWDSDLTTHLGAILLFLFVWSWVGMHSCKINLQV